MPDTKDFAQTVSKGVTMMSSRSVFSLVCRHAHVALGAACLAVLGLGACDNPTGLQVTAEAAISCPNETPVVGDTAPNGTTMLPGRVCGACHRTGGQAQNSPWTLAGTIYTDPMSTCNTGGLAGVTIEVLYTSDDPMGRYKANQVQPGGTLMSNEVGNFYSSGLFVSPMRIHIYTGPASLPTKEMYMTTLVGRDPVTNQSVRVDCNACHFAGAQAGNGITPAGGHIYLQ
jgi:hypothetical protein